MPADGSSCRRERCTALRQEAAARWSFSIEDRILVLSEAKDPLRHFAGGPSPSARLRIRSGLTASEAHRLPIIAAAAFHLTRGGGGDDRLRLQQSGIRDTARPCGWMGGWRAIS